MGTSITKEIINQIHSKKLPVNPKTLKKDNFNKNISDILNNIYSPIYDKNFKNNEKELNENNRIIENKIINEKNKIIEKEEEIGNLIYKKNKSIDIASNNIYKILLLDDNIINQNYKNEEIYSDKDNESNNSDYIDISKKFISINTININNKLLKSKKIRDSYYHKLIIKNQWNPLQKDNIFNNIFIFDWDDTLLCTTYLVSTGALNEMEINKKDKEIISGLDILVSKLLSKTIKLGFVFIITNGAPGWIELSSVKFYPETAKILEKIKIITARGLYEKKLPGDMRQWKTLAFKYAIDSMKIKRSIPTNIICLGDSVTEIEASYNIKEYFHNAYLKTIKFKESPTHKELEKELKNVQTQIDSILPKMKNLSIKYTKKKE